MSPVRKHFWHVVARVNSSFTFPRKWSLNWFMPAGVNSTEGSHVGTSTSLGQRLCPLVSKKARYFSRSSSVFIKRACGMQEAEWPRRNESPGRLANIPGKVRTGQGARYHDLDNRT